MLTKYTELLSILRNIMVAHIVERIVLYCIISATRYLVGIEKYSLSACGVEMDNIVIVTEKLYLLSRDL